MSTDHVVRHQQKFLSRHPRIVFLDDSRKFGDSTSMHITRQNQMQNRHEMAFPATKAAMQIGRFAGVSLQ